MSQSIDQAFIKQYESEVHAAYQRQGSQLRNFVRRSTKTPGQDITFQKVGKGSAQGKTRHGDVPVMNIDHTPVTCTLVDRYAADYVDKFDQLKTNIDERKVTVDAGAWALGRTTDEFIIAQLDAATGGSGVDVNLSAITAATLVGLITRLGARDVPIGDGKVAAAVSWEVWGKMLTIQEFVNSQWVGTDELPLKTRMQAKYWAGAIWFPHSGLSIASNVRKVYAWHADAIGHGIGSEVVTDINWVPTKAAWFVNNMMSQGAKLIDDNGVERLDVTENA